MTSQQQLYASHHLRTTTNTNTTSEHRHDSVYYVSEEINLAVRWVPLILHAFGLYLLHILRRRRKHHQVIHVKLIQHLSISELGLVLTSVVISALLILVVPPVIPPKDGGSSRLESVNYNSNATGYRNINRDIDIFNVEVNSIVDDNSTMKGDNFTEQRNIQCRENDTGVTIRHQSTTKSTFKMTSDSSTDNHRPTDAKASVVEKLLVNSTGNEDNVTESIKISDSVAKGYRNPRNDTTDANVSSHDHNHWNQVVYVLIILKNTGFSLVYYVVNILITVDRFLEMKLNIKYPQLISNRTVNVVLSVVWFSGTVFAAVIMYLGKAHQDFDHVSFSYLYFFFPMEMLFLFTALATYAYILKEYVRMSSVFHSMPRRNQIDILGTTRKLKTKNNATSKCSEQLSDFGNINSNNSSNNDGSINRSSSSRNNNNNNNNSNKKHEEDSVRVTRYKVRTLFRRSSPLVMISLLVTTFVFFMMLPDILNFSYYVRHSRDDTEEKPWTLVLSTYIMYTLAYTSDALIYIVLQKETRAIIRKKFFQNRQTNGGLSDCTLTKS